jgi:hypothetical protein
MNSNIIACVSLTIRVPSDSIDSKKKKEEEICCTKLLIFNKYNESKIKTTQQANMIHRPGFVLI